MDKTNKIKFYFDSHSDARCMYAPLLNDSASLHLTPSDWESIGLTHVAIDLLNWLIRLEKESEVRASSVEFCPISRFFSIPKTVHTIFLSSVVREGHKTSGYPKNKASFSLYSSHDGQKISVTQEKIHLLVEQFKKQFPEKKIIAITEAESSEITPPDQKLSEQYSISAKPAIDGEKGILYGMHDESITDICIQDEKWASISKPISSNCGCYTCKNFTLAYLHHLEKADVLLGKRLQIIHNMTAYKGI